MQGNSHVFFYSNIHALIGFPPAWNTDSEKVTQVDRHGIDGHYP